MKSETKQLLDELKILRCHANEQITFSKEVIKKTKLDKNKRRSEKIKEYYKGRLSVLNRLEPLMLNLADSHPK